MKLQIEYRPVDSLIPYAKNAKKHPAEQISQIAGSLKEFGFINPVIIDKEGSIVAGHGRVLAAQKLGMTEVPTLKAEHLTPTQIKAFRLADNRIAQNGEWDKDLLSIELEELDNLGIDLEGLGFDLDELPKDEGTEGLTDPDDVPDEPKDVWVKPGDLFALGNHRLLCGDSTTKKDVERLLAGQKVDMVFTDPPYNIDYGNIKHPKFKIRSIENDNMSGADFRTFCQGFAASIAMATDGCIYVFGPPGADGRIMFTVLDEMFHCSTTIVWNKDQFTLGRGKYQNKYEPCWFGWRLNGSSFVDDRTLANVWDVPRPKSSELHPTMKPVELVERAISDASSTGNSVLDLFCGSGTTMIAAEKTGRRCFGMEIDPAYCDVIVARWEKYTGKTAVKSPE